jgi:competence protein ComEC
MRTWVLGFLIGIISLNTFHHLPHLGWLFLSLAPLALFWATPHPLWQWLRLPLAMALGFSWVLAHAYLHTLHNLPPAYVNKAVSVQGVIQSLPEQKAHGWQFDFAIQKIAAQEHWQPLPVQVRLTWKQPLSTLFTGQQWQLRVQLKPPHSTLNPGEFDYEAWLFARNIKATGSVRSNPANQLLHAPYWTSFVQAIRQHLAQVITMNLGNSPMTGFIQALAVGIRDHIMEEQWQVLRNTGTNHLMAIAGLHIGLITGVIWFIVSFVGRRCPRLTLYLPITQLAALAALLVAFIYSALAGFALPTQRAVIMISVFLLALLLRRQLPAAQALFLALLGILLLDPLATLSASFWLSFSAVGLIIYGLAARVSQPHWLQRWGYLQWMLAIGLIPWTLLFFQQISLSGVIANFLAIPWVGFIVLPLTLLGNISTYVYPPAAGELFRLAAQLMAIFWPLLVKLSSWQWLQWHAAMTNNWLLLSNLVAVVLLLAPRGLPGRWLGIFWLLPLLFWQPPAPQAGQVWLTLLDVGQGLVAVVRTQQHTLIYDVAPAFNGGLNKVTEIVMPFLEENKIASIDSVLLDGWSNRTPDLTLWAALQPRNIENIASCLAPHAWQWDGIQFAVVALNTPTVAAQARTTCALQITAGKRQLLLVANLASKNVGQFLAAHPSEVVVTRWNRFIPDFLATLANVAQPHYVLYAAASLPAATAAKYNTAACGAISLHLDDNSLSPPVCYRATNGRYWNSPLTQ